MTDKEDKINDSSRNNQIEEAKSLKKIGRRKSSTSDEVPLKQSFQPTKKVMSPIIHQNESNCIQTTEEVELDNEYINSLSSNHIMEVLGDQPYQAHFSKAQIHEAVRRCNKWGSQNIPWVDLNFEVPTWLFPTTKDSERVFSKKCELHASLYKLKEFQMSYDNVIGIIQLITDPPNLILVIDKLSSICPSEFADCNDQSRCLLDSDAEEEHEWY